jgi:hypothetical protein
MYSISFCHRADRAVHRFRSCSCISTSSAGSALVPVFPPVSTGSALVSVFPPVPQIPLWFLFSRQCLLVPLCFLYFHQFSRFRLWFLFARQCLPVPLWFPIPVSVYRFRSCSCFSPMSTGSALVPVFPLVSTGSPLGSVFPLVTTGSALVPVSRRCPLVPLLFLSTH